MNLALLDIKIIQIINRYSINGSVSTDNQDYLLRTRNLIDSCQKEIANIFPVIKSAEFTQVSSSDPLDYTFIGIPADCEKILNVELKSYPEFKSISYKVYNDNILVSPYIEGTIIVTYTKIINDITTDTSENTELEIDKTYQEFIPYYVAGHIYFEDNPTIATTLLNEYEQKLLRAKPKNVSGQNSVGNGWGW